MTRAERGLAVSVEAAILLPVLVLFLGLLVTLARVALAEQGIGAAASAGAREATLVSQGRKDAAWTAAERALAGRGVRCASTTVSVSDSTGPGEVATVTVTIDCRVSLADVSLPFIPGSLTVSAARTSPIDPYR